MSIVVDFGAYEDILRKHLAYAGDGPLASAGVLADLGLSSLGIMRLLNDLEVEFDFEMPDEALTPDTFKTVGSLWDVVSALLG